MLTSLNYLHSKKIVHRDIRPEHVLFNSDKIDSNLKLRGFGKATYINKPSKLDLKKCYKYYLAPELLADSYTEKCDIWSTGVVMYLLLSGYLPFNGNSENEVLENVKRGLYTINKSAAEWTNISTEAVDLIKCMLVVNPKDRYTAQ